jgi:hypothetical protein
MMLKFLGCSINRNTAWVIEREYGQSSSVPFPSHSGLTDEQGFIHAPNPTSRSTDKPLPSLPLSSLVKSPDEVAAILPFPLSALHDTHRRSIHHFRVDPRKPYYRFRAEDLVHWPAGLEVDELEVWGLSGWFLNRLAWRLGWIDRPLPEVYEG